MYSIHKVTGLLACGLLLFVSACKKDSPEQTPQLDLSNPASVTSALTIKDATLKKGTPPTPSASASAPKILAESSQDIVTAAGFTFLINANVKAGSAKGVYVVVNGADSYFDITNINNRSARVGVLGLKNPKSAHSLLSGARLQKTTEEDEVSIGIKIPENIKPGKFCITYCVYDANGQVSNLIAKCVEIKEFSGNSQLAGNWSFTKIESIDPENSFTLIPEVEMCDASTFPCPSTPVEVEACDKVNKFDMLFGADGAWLNTFEIGYKVPDFSTICDKLTYKTGVSTTVYNGAWSYDSVNKKIYLIINYTDEDGTNTYIETAEFTVSKLTASELEFEVDDTEYFFKKN